MADGHSLFPVSGRRSAGPPVRATEPPRRRPRVWPLAVALLLLAGSLVADVTALLVAHEIVRRVEVVDPDGQ
jgi:hypothetical protein